MQLVDLKRGRRGPAGSSEGSGGQELVVRGV